MLKIEIHDAVLQKLPITTKKGKQMTMFKQTAWVHLAGEPYPKELKLTLWADRDTGLEPTAYPKGEYLLSPKSFSVNPYGELRISPELIQPTGK